MAGGPANPPCPIIFDSGGSLFTSPSLGVAGGFGKVTWIHNKINVFLFY